MLREFQAKLQKGTAKGAWTYVVMPDVTSAGIMDHEEAFQAIADLNSGTRASGTPGYDASLAYVKGKLDATSYFNTRVQEFDFDYFQELAPAQFERISPNPEPYVLNDDFVTMEYSGSGDVTGELVPAGGIMIPPGRQQARRALAVRRLTSPRPRQPSRSR